MSYVFSVSLSVGKLCSVFVGKQQVSCLVGVAPHQMARADFLNAELLTRTYRAQYVTETGEIIASSRFTPAYYPALPLGCWQLEQSSRWNKYGDCVEQLRLIPTGQVQGKEDPQERIHDVTRYAEWLREGKMAPPIRAAATRQGKFLISDGHRRLAAHRLVGASVILAWVSPWADTGLRDTSQKPIDTDLTHQLAVCQAQALGQAIPPRVMQDYPEIGVVNSTP